MAKNNKNDKRRRSSTQGKPDRVTAGVAWYEPDQWPRLKALAEDRARLDDTYEEWMEGVELIEHEAKGRGVRVVRVPLNVDRLARWCRAHDLPFDSSTRAKYVSSRLADYLKMPPGTELPEQLEPDSRAANGE